VEGSVNDIADDLMNQVRPNAGSFQTYSIEMDKNSDIKITPELAVFIRG
jgi:hypothetical protein